MNGPLLYTFRRCPYAMRARMALAISNVAHESIEVSLKQKPVELIRVSAKATVPVLVLPDQRVIDESLDIMHWALAQHDPENWLGPDPELSRQLIAENDFDFKVHLDRYKYPGRYDDSDPLTHRAAGLEFLRKLDARLENNPCLIRATRSLADIAIFPFIRQFARHDMTWFEAQELPKLQAWLSALIASPLYVTIMATPSRK